MVAGLRDVGRAVFGGMNRLILGIHHRGAKGTEKDLRDLFISQFVLYDSDDYYEP